MNAEPTYAQLGRQQAELDHFARGHVEVIRAELQQRTERADLARRALRGRAPADPAASLLAIGWEKAFWQLASLLAFVTDHEARLLPERLRARRAEVAGSLGERVVTALANENQGWSDQRRAAVATRAERAQMRTHAHPHLARAARTHPARSSRQAEREEGERAR